MGQGCHVQENKEQDLEETVRQATPELANDLRTIAMETTNDDKLLKTIVCQERQSINQVPDKYEHHTKNSG